MKNTITNITVKAILTFVIAFGIQLSGLIASNIGDVVTPSEPNSLFCPECPVLSPKVPLEAPFMEFTEFDFTMSLFPVVPMEAEFDNGIEVELTANSFSPSLPTQADFDDEVSPNSLNKRFIPIVPATADFRDSL